MKIKRLATIALLAALIFVASPQPAEAAFALGTKTLSTEGGRSVDIFTQSSTGLTTVQDVFEAHKVMGIFTWTLYIHNTGAQPLTDLNVLINYQNSDWANAPMNLVDSQPSVSDWNNGCTTTLAATTVCQIGIAASEPLGWLKVTASAAVATNLTIVLIAKDL